MGKSFCICKDGTCKRRTGPAYGESRGCGGDTRADSLYCGEIRDGRACEVMLHRSLCRTVSASVRMGSATHALPGAKLRPRRPAQPHGRRPGHHAPECRRWLRQTSGATVNAAAPASRAPSMCCTVKTNVTSASVLASAMTSSKTAAERADVTQAR